MNFSQKDNLTQNIKKYNLTKTRKNQSDQTRLQTHPLPTRPRQKWQEGQHHVKTPKGLRSEYHTGVYSVNKTLLKRTF